MPDAVGEPVTVQLNVRVDVNVMVGDAVVENTGLMVSVCVTVQLGLFVWVYVGLCGFIVPVDVGVLVHVIVIVRVCD